MCDFFKRGYTTAFPLPPPPPSPQSPEPEPVEEYLSSVQTMFGKLQLFLLGNLFLEKRVKIDFSEALFAEKKKKLFRSALIEL